MKVKKICTHHYLAFGAIGSLMLASSGINAAPSIPTVTQQGSDFRLTWSGQTGNWLGVDRSYPGCGGTCYENIYSAGATNAFTDRNVSPGVAYRYKVYDSTGHNGYSAAKQLTETGGDTGNSSSCADPVISGSSISFGDSSCWYQLQNLDTQNYNVCQGLGHQISGCGTLQAGASYLVKRFTASPWTQYASFRFNAPSTGNDNNDDDSNNETASCPSGNTSTPAGYSEIFRDDFCGNTLSNKFYPAGFNVSGRDTVNNVNSCSQSNGVLNLSIKNVGNQRQACYLRSHKNDFGPGNNSTLRVEFRANVSEVKALGSWFAGWLYPRSKEAAEDGIESNGAEFDVFEYMPTWDTAYNTAIHDNQSSEEWVQANTFGINLTQNRYHTYSMEWNKDCVVFSIDGNEIEARSALVSNEPVHEIRLSMEAETGTQWDYWNVGNFANNLNNNPAVGKLDWVRVLKKNSVSSSLCSGLSDRSNRTDDTDTETSDGNNDSTNSDTSSNVCTVSGNTFAAAIANYAANCSLPRRDCDPVNGQWYCSSENVENNPVVTAGDSSDRTSPDPEPQAEPDTDAPTISYTSPGSTTSEGAVTVSGTANDASGIRLVRALILARDQNNQRYNFSTNQFSSSRVYADTVKTATLSNKSNTGADWSFSIPNLAPGNYRLRTKVWDTLNNSTTWSIYDFAVSANAGSERTAAMQQAMSALESYRTANGTYKVPNSGWRGNGSGWFFYDGNNYPNSVADALTAAGHPVLLTDPLHTSSTRVNGDYLIYHCKNRVGLFSRHGTAEDVTSSADSTWWNSNGCPRHPLDSLNSNYFILSK